MQVSLFQDSDPEFVPLDASRPQRAVADYNSKQVVYLSGLYWLHWSILTGLLFLYSLLMQIVNQCGLWRPAANKDGVPIKRIAGGVQVNAFGRALSSIYNSPGSPRNPSLAGQYQT